MKIIYNQAKNMIFACPARNRCDRIFGGTPNCPHAIDHMADAVCSATECREFKNVQCREMEDINEENL